MKNYLEPIIFAENNNFLAGREKNLEGYLYVDDYNEALKLFFDQNLPSEYMIWQDFWELHTRYISQNRDFKMAMQKIAIEIQQLNPDSQKHAIRARLEFLKKKKQGLINPLFTSFKEEIESELYEILEMVSVQRFLYEVSDPILEEIFYIIKNGCFPCGIKKDEKTLVIYNPINLKNS